MRLLVTGGAGFVGSRLVPALLTDGHEVVVIDTFWFGDNLPFHPKLHIVKLDIRQTDALRDFFWRVDAVLHLAAISNDPSFELDENLSRTINYECFEPMVVVAKEAGVKRFIYCSTSSVYGISDAPQVTEDHPLVPITLYNTYKAKCEPILFKHQSDDFICTTIRPSTICGYSPRQRLDLAVNILTNLAVNKGRITVHGGQQMRPNLHIQDMVDCYKLLLTAPKDKIAGQIFNVGAQNLSINDLAVMVQRVMKARYGRDIPIENTGSVDMRSYQVNSNKIRWELGFRSKYKVEDAIHELCDAFDAGKIPNPLDDDRYYNVRQLRKIMPEIYKNAPPLTVDHTKGHLSDIDVVHRS